MLFASDSVDDFELVERVQNPLTLSEDQIDFVHVEHDFQELLNLEDACLSLSCNDALIAFALYPGGRFMNASAKECAPVNVHSYLVKVSGEKYRVSTKKSTEGDWKTVGRVETGRDEHGVFAKIAIVNTMSTREMIDLTSMPMESLYLFPVPIHQTDWRLNMIWCRCTPGCITLTNGIDFWKFESQTDEPPEVTRTVDESNVRKVNTWRCLLRIATRVASWVRRWISGV